VLEDGEVFDSSLLKETINKLIALGKRNFALDLSSLDYIYSDSINALMALNKRTLDVSGRLSLLAPQDEVLQILKRAGIHNILRIFDTEEDLLKTSEDIILQTTSIKLGDIKAITQEEEVQKPQSEFDQLRSEIGSVFGGSSDDVSHMPPPPPPKTKSIPGAMRQEQIYMPPSQMPDQSIDHSFNDAFRQFDSEPEQTYVPPPPPTTGQFRVVPPQSQFAPPPPPPTRSGFMPQQFQGRQMPPQAPVPPVRPATPFGTNDSIPDYGNVRNETQRYPAPPTRMTPITKSDSPFDESDTMHDMEPFGKKKPSKAPVSDDSFEDTGDDFMDEEVTKKSPVPMIIIILLIVAIGGAGAYFGLNQFMQPQKKVEKPVPPQAPTPAPAPQVPVETAPAAVAVPESKPVEPPVVEDKKPEPVKKPVTKPVVESKPKAEPKPRPAVSEPKKVNKIVFVSNPSGAKVTVNGDYMGTTPYTWNEPIFGALSVVVTKDGYQDETKFIEFEGGSSKEVFTLTKVAPTPSPVARTPEPTPEPVRPSTPPPAAQPVVSAGGDASIFIASIPPVADVYLDGKLIGKTNVSEIKLPAGTHNLRFVKGPKETSQVITVQPGKNPSKMVRLP